MNIYLVRHCKAEGQPPGADLTEKGHEQAAKLAAFLSEKDVDGIFSSPFVRAIQSVAPLAEKLQISITTDERLSERILCGENHSNWREMLRNTFADLELVYEGGESSAAAMNRIISAIRDIRESGLTNVVIVTHGNLMSLILKYFDSNVGFVEWEALSNPDVYLLEVNDSKATIQRIWG